MEEGWGVGRLLLKCITLSLTINYRSGYNAYDTMLRLFMLPSIQSLGIDRMSQEDRLRLIGEIWDSLEPIEDELFEEHQAIIEQRLKAARERPEARVPWEEALVRLQAKS